MTIVGRADFRIVINKFFIGFLYALIITFIGWGIALLAGSSLSLAYPLLASLIYGIMEALLKYFRSYKPEYYEEFKWFYDVLMDAFVAWIAKLSSSR